MVQRWVVGVFLPGPGTAGFTMFSNCCRLLPGPGPGPGPRAPEGDEAEVAGKEAGDDTGVATPRLELGRGWGDILLGIGDIWGRGEGCVCGDSCGEAWGKGVLYPGVPLGTWDPGYWPMSA